MKKNIIKSGVLVFGLMFVFVGNVFAGAIYDNGTDVGVGTTSPAVKLDVNGTIRSTRQTFPQTGTGIELFYEGVGRLFAYDRDAATYKGMKIDSVPLVLNYYSQGNVGIGVDNPTAKLDVAGTINSNWWIDSTTDDNYLSFRAKQTGAVYGFSDPHVIVAGGHNSFVIGTHYDSDFAIMTAGIQRIKVAGNGDISIGTPTPKTGYKLTVNGGIYAEFLRVKNDVAVNTLTVMPQTWSDFVFEDDYNLMPLAEVENKIKTQKHLPGIPSEAEVKKNGVSVGEMQAKLLQKIEELTLYVIEQNKKIEAQHSTLQTQAQEIKELRNRVDSGQVVSVY
ncbi:hypothetical protein ACFL2K_03960 [Candidatus Margulisiibacteriota bacterium]